MKHRECTDCERGFVPYAPNQKRCMECRRLRSGPRTEAPGPVLRECDKCGTPFERTHPARKFCDTCRSRPAQTDVAICPVCSTAFIVHPAPGRPRVYCTRECARWANLNPSALADYRRMVEESKRDPLAMDRYMVPKEGGQ